MEAAAAAAAAAGGCRRSAGSGRSFGSAWRAWARGLHSSRPCSRDSVGPSLCIHTHYQDKLQTQAGATWLRPLLRVCVLLVCILWLVGDEEERQVELAEALAAVALPHATKQAARVNATSTTVGATYDPKFGDVGAHAARLLALRLLSLPVRRPRAFRTSRARRHRHMTRVCVCTTCLPTHDLLSGWLAAVSFGRCAAHSSRRRR